MQQVTVARPRRDFTGFLVEGHEPVRAAAWAVKWISMSNITLSLICHAPTVAVRNAAFPSDEPLDLQGGAMAAAAADTVRRVDEAWTSPALRARQTADAMRLEARIDPLLRDLDYGSWTGRSLDEVAAADPSGSAAWISDTSAAPHGGESVDELLNRVSTWLRTAGGRNGRVVAVTHASVIRAAVVTVLDAKSASFWRIDVAPLCRVRLRGRGGRWSLLSVGR
jgi:broad specificity phosphatase PhoE